MPVRCGSQNQCSSAVGRLPTSGDYAFEPKWDGFRALVSRSGELRVKSRRGWDMTSLVPELEALPDGLKVQHQVKVCRWADRVARWFVPLSATASLLVTGSINNPRA